MANSAKVDLKLRSSVNTDYSEPHIGPVTITVTASPTKELCEKILATTGTVTVSTARFTAMSNLILQNEDSSISITLVHTSTAGAESTVVAAGQVYMTPDVAVGNITLTSASGTPSCRLWVFGT